MSVPKVIFLLKSKEMTFETDMLNVLKICKSFSKFNFAYHALYRMCLIIDIIEYSLLTLLALSPLFK